LRDPIPYHNRRYPTRSDGKHLCRAHGLKGLERSVLRFAGIKPIRESLFGAVASASAATRQKWLEKMHALGAPGI
jgi:putative NADPH-quinone reductase